MADSAKKTFGKSMSFRIVVYPAEFDRSYFNAHCLELDVFGQDSSVQGAIAEVMQAIESQLDMHFKHKTQLEHWAPPIIWQKYEQARRAKRSIADELLDRLIQEANTRLGYESPVNIDTVAGTKDAAEAWQECVEAGA